MNNKELLVEIIKCKSSGLVSRVLALMIIKMTHKVLGKPQYRIHLNDEDMIAHAHLHLCKVILVFEPSKSSNPYAFCVTVITGAFHSFMARHRREMEITNIAIERSNPNPAIEDILYNKDRDFEYQFDVNIVLNIDEFYRWAEECKGTWKIDMIYSAGHYKLKFNNKDDAVFAKMTFG